jgi:hypothetical protein
MFIGNNSALAGWMSSLHIYVLVHRFGWLCFAKYNFLDQHLEPLEDDE